MANSCCITSKHYSNYFSRYANGKNPPISPYLQPGGSLTPFVGYKYHNYQEGAGIGGLLAGLMRRAIPLIKPAISLASRATRKIIKPVLKQTAKKVGEEIIKGGINVGISSLEGKNIKESMKEEAKHRLDNVKKEASKALKRHLHQTEKHSDEPPRKKRKTVIKTSKTKRNNLTKKRDIFG